MKLKPCPFCGSKARQISRGKQFGCCHAVGCSNAHCIIWLPDDVLKKDLHNYAFVWVEESDMVEAWNKRGKK